MKTIFSHLFVLLTLCGACVGCLATNAQARLGESKAQLIERYGEPLRDEKAELPASDSAALFFKDNVEIHVEFKNDKAWMVSYRTHTLTSELEASFRDANDGEDGIGEWREPVEHLLRNYWKTQDGKVTAVTYLVGSLKIFKFCTEDCVAALIDFRRGKVNSVVAGESGAESATPGEGGESAKKDNPF